MKKLILFQCDRCGTQYKDEEKAETCEKSHHSAICFSDSIYHANCDYPDRLQIVFDDGEKIWYKR